MKTSFFNVLLLAILALTVACSSDGGSGGGKGGKNSPQFKVGSCDNIVSEEDVLKYNQQQNKYRIETAGFNVSCSIETNVNGKKTKIQKNGNSAIAIFPTYKFLNVAKHEQTHKIIISTELSYPNAEEQRSILKDLGFKLKKDEALPSEVNYRGYPAYARFEKGAIFYLIDELFVDLKDEKYGVQFSLTAEDEDLGLLNQQLEKYLVNPVGLELLWWPRDQKLSAIDLQADFSPWENQDAVQVLRSMVRDNDNRASAKALDHAMDLALAWKVNLQNLDQQLPELNYYAESEWESPNFNGNDQIKALRIELEYLVKLNPSHRLSSVFETYNKISYYFDNSEGPLKTAYQYHIERKWSKKQFDALVQIATLLAPGTGSHSWDFSTAINERTDYDINAGSFLAEVTSHLIKRNLVSRSNVSEALAAAQAKIDSGLNNTNKKYYFSLFELLDTEFNLTAKTAEKISDEFVIGNLVKESQLNLVLDQVRWLKNEVYLNYEDGFKETLKVVRANGPSAVIFKLIKDVYAWVNGTVYLNRQDSLAKGTLYASQPGFTVKRFDVLKSYFEWLTGTIYLGRSAALEKAESAVITNNISEQNISAIKDLADWYIQTIYLNRSEALQRSEKLIVEKKLTASHAKLLKEAVSWMVNDLYFNRSAAAAKGEELLYGTNPLSDVSFKNLKGLTDWYINSIYMNRSAAFEKSEDLIMVQGLSLDQTKLLMESATWLINTLYMNKSNAAEKAELYVIENKMTAAKFASLKVAYNKYTSQFKPKDEALRLAEKDVFKI